MSELELDFPSDFGDKLGGRQDVFTESMELSDEAALLGILEVAPDDLGAINSLAHIHKQRGQLDKAEAGYRQILSYSGRNNAAQAVAYFNLGSICMKRGEQVKALEYYEDARNLFEERENTEGMAVTFFNIANIYRVREEMDLAEEFYKKSLSLNESLGKELGIVADYTSLGLLYFKKEELDKAEAMYKKAFSIDEGLGRKEGMAIMLGNIGAIARKRNDLELARENWVKALAIFQELGMGKMVVKVQRWLDFLQK